MSDAGTDKDTLTYWMLSVRDRKDRAAFEQIYDHFAPKLTGFLIKSGATRNQAEDIVQDAMLSVWHKAHQFDPSRATVSAWIYQIARNRHIDVVRKESRPVPEELAGEPITDTENSASLAMEQEAQALRKALDKLKPNQREMIEKAFLGELTHAQISLDTGVALGTIKSRIRLGLARLKHEMKELRR